MSEDERSIELEVEVPGTPDEVWRAIATGPGISSWYVPHVVEEREGGDAVASFGPEPEMQAPGRVAAWDPPNRVVFDGGDGVGGLAFEWLVEGRDGGTCIVRLVNSGFAGGEEWDDHYDAMHDGWQLFLLNLKLHLTHFAGQDGTAALPLGSWPGPREQAHERMLVELGIDGPVAVGDRVEVSAADAPPLAGTVVEQQPWRLSLLLDEPAPGTAFIAAEGAGDEVQTSIWSYLYGPEAAAIAERDDARWRAWLAEHAAPASD